MANIISISKHGDSTVTVFDDNSYRYSGYGTYPNSLFSILDDGRCKITHPKYGNEVDKEFILEPTNEFVILLNKAILNHVFEQDVLKNN